MKRLDAPLLTPIYAKTTADAPWPADQAFYTLSRDGIFFCRNEKFFRSAILARRPPGELAAQQEFLSIDFPPLDPALLEQAVGFFDWAYQRRGAESILLLGWNEARQAVELIAPDQVASSYRNVRGELFAESVKYEFPQPLPKGIEIFGDIHSHCEMSARASGMDQQDEALFNGLHIVAGRLDDEPPQWHVEAVVDGTRFLVDPQQVVAGYRQRDPNFPAEWQTRHAVEYSGFLGPVTSTGSTSYLHSRDHWSGEAL